MRIATALISALVASSFALTACSDKEDADAEPFDTLQACYDDHHNDEMLSVQKAIVVCCLDHPIAGVHPSCGTTQAECMTHVDAELDSSVVTADIQAACTDYISQK
jgi:hypothetical protein